MSHEAGIGGESHFIKLARQLDTMEFQEVMKIISLIDNGQYTILPWLYKVCSRLDYINPYNLCRCSRLKVLSIPNCKTISNSTLINLPYIESLTISSVTNLKGDIFYHMNYLKHLQIISHTYSNPDKLLTKHTVKYLDKLKILHVYNNMLSEGDFCHLKSLEVLILETSNRGITPKIMDLMPRLELCIINHTLYKFKETPRNEKIVKKIGKITKIRILG